MLGKTLLAAGNLGAFLLIMTAVHEKERQRIRNEYQKKRKMAGGAKRPTPKAKQNHFPFTFPILVLVTVVTSATFLAMRGKRTNRNRKGKGTDFLKAGGDHLSEISSEDSCDNESEKQTHSTGSPSTEEQCTEMESESTGIIAREITSETEVEKSVGERESEEVLKAEEGYKGMAVKPLHLPLPFEDCNESPLFTAPNSPFLSWSGSPRPVAGECDFQDFDFQDAQLQLDGETIAELGPEVNPETGANVCTESTIQLNSEVEATTDADALPEALEKACPAADSTEIATEMEMETGFGAKAENLQDDTRSDHDMASEENLMISKPSEESLVTPLTEEPPLRVVSFNFPLMSTTADNSAANSESFTENQTESLSESDSFSSAGTAGSLTGGRRFQRRKNKRKLRGSSQAMVDEFLSINVGRELRELVKRHQQETSEQSGASGCTSRLQRRPSILEGGVRKAPCSAEQSLTASNISSLGEASLMEWGEEEVDSLDVRKERQKAVGNQEQREDDEVQSKRKVTPYVPGSDIQFNTRNEDVPCRESRMVVNHSHSVTDVSSLLQHAKQAAERVSQQHKKLLRELSVVAEM